MTILVNNFQISIVNPEWKNASAELPNPGNTGINPNFKVLTWNGRCISIMSFAFVRDLQGKVIGVFYNPKTGVICKNVTYWSY